MSNPLAKLSKQAGSLKDTLEVLDGSHLDGLNIKEAKFVKAYLDLLSQTKAAIVAGYKEAHAKKAGQRMMDRPRVIKALDMVKAELSRQAVYDAEKAIKEIDEKIEVAQDLKQMTAVANLLKLKAVLTGLYSEKMQIDHNVKGGFSVHVPDFKPPSYVNEAIDVTPGAPKLDTPQKPE